MQLAKNVDTLFKTKRFFTLSLVIDFSENLVFHSVRVNFFFFKEMSH